MDKGIKPVVWTTRATKDLEKTAVFYRELYGSVKARK
ncbi:MAG: type II toxin-antitoxin system RelE/ParE family toxin, partial [Bacteroidetes bacterium HGW-Bacteroidetes-2]